MYTTYYCAYFTPKFYVYLILIIDILIVMAKEENKYISTNELLY